MAFLTKFSTTLSRASNIFNRFSSRSVHLSANLSSLEQVSSDQILKPPSSDKSYDPKIEAIVNSIADLKLHEVADLNDLLKKTLNISDAPMMAAVAPTQATTADAEEEVVPERNEFTIKLSSFDAGSKIKLIKVVKSIKTDLNLVQAKKLVEMAPQILKEDVTKEECEEIKKQLEEAGGVVELI